MVRSKLKLNYIHSNSARKTSYKKRSACFLKKTSKLSMTCDVQACSILYGPYCPTPEVWPTVEGAREALMRLRNMSEFHQGENKVTLESFTNDQIRKYGEKLEIYRKKNFHNDMSRLMYDRMRGESTSNVSLEDLQEMRKISDQKMREITEKLEEIKLRESVNASQDANGMGLIGGLTADLTETLGKEPVGGFTVDPNISSNFPTDPTDGCEDLTDELLAIYRGFNFKENSTLISDTHDRDSVRPNHTNP